MFYTKYPHRANFTFAESFDAKTGLLQVGSRELHAKAASYAGDIFHVKVESQKLWGGNRCLAPLDIPETATSNQVSLGEGFRISVKGKSGKPIVELAKQGFGLSGNAHMFVFELAGDAKFYGMGEKNFGQIELSGLRTKFWTTDVWSDFHFAQWLEHAADPPYFATPYVVVKVKDEYVGFLLHNPYPTFMETPGTDETRIFVEWQRTAPNLILGAEGGQPDLWIIYGPSLREVTTKLQKLVGVTPLPPLWSLGYHQSRWEYGGDKDILRLRDKFVEHRIPCDAIWLDLDYMDGFRIFRTNPEQFPRGVEATARELRQEGMRIVPIIDPGVKAESGYHVFDDGAKKGVFCKNEEGRNFIGMVWPGQTVFPDFSLKRVRGWWAGYVAGFAREGYGAAWLDMNDPSTGPVDPTGMRFENGRLTHESHHNQYALGMQMASRDGFLRARRAERPFLLSRSGFIGTSRYSAIWTGDNLSSYYYLQMSIPASIGMSLSGVPFNGPDVGGFGGNVTEPLMVDWVKACFLFPFMRNHSMKDSRSQEPWTFSTTGMRAMRKFIRLRYKFLPYLYNLFIQQEERGEPIMRPLIYEFDEPEYANTSDVFLIGPSILQAPIVTEKARSRAVSLPKGEWFDACSGRWESGSVVAKPKVDETPLFVRNGAIIPMQRGTATSNRKSLRQIEIHVFANPASTGKNTIRYAADDGISFAYKNGKRTAIEISIRWNKSVLEIDWEHVQTGFGTISPVFILHGPTSAKINRQPASLKPVKLALSGRGVTALAAI